MTIATASPTGDTGSTTCPSTRRASGLGHRAWRTDLHTGRTEATVGPPYDLDTLNTYFDTFYPPGGYGPEGADSLWRRPTGGGTDLGWLAPSTPGHR